MANKKKKHFWDRLASPELKKDFAKRSWGGINKIGLNYNYLVTGDRNYYWIDYMRDTYFKEGYAGHVLSLGCGEGFVERLFKLRGFSFDSITGVDISSVCTEAAQKLAEEAQLAPQIAYIAADLNTYVPPENTYDFIFFFHSLHHVENVEALLEHCRKALLPNGLFMLNEYIGPSRFQWTPEQLEEANRLFKLLPEELRFNLATRETMAEIKRPSVETMIEVDESEAVRSEHIAPALKHAFEIIEEKNWGGTLNNLIFENTAGNYDPDNTYHNAIVELLIHHENSLIDNNILPSDFKFYMARPR